MQQLPVTDTSRLSQHGCQCQVSCSCPLLSTASQQLFPGVKYPQTSLKNEIIPEHCLSPCLYRSLLVKGMPVEERVSAIEKAGYNLCDLQQNKRYIKQMCRASPKLCEDIRPRREIPLDLEKRRARSRSRTTNTNTTTTRYCIILENMDVSIREAIYFYPACFPSFYTAVLQISSQLS